MQIDLTDEEIEVLRRIVARYHANLRFEIQRTDARAYRTQLKTEEGVVDAIESKIATRKELDKVRAAGAGLA